MASRKKKRQKSRQGLDQKPKKAPAPPRRPPGRLRATTALGLGAACLLLGFATGNLARQGVTRFGFGESGGTTPRTLVPGSGTLAAAEAQFQKGFALYRTQRFSEALAEFEKAATLDPTDPRPHHGMGKIHNELVLQEKAEESFRNALRVDPGFRPSQEALAVLLHEKGHYEEAMTILRRMERDNAEDPIVWAEMAVNQIKLGRPREAIALLERYNTVKGRQAWGYVHLGRACAETGQLKRAEALYREAVEIDPRFSLGHYWLGQLLVATGREAESTRSLETYRRLRTLSTEEHQLKMALLRDSDSVKVLVNLARVRFNLGKGEESLATLERARQIAPNDAELEALYRQVEQKVRGGSGQKP